jgi:hypothetical protein
MVEMIWRGTCLETVERKDPLANQLARFFEDADAQAGQVGKNDLAKGELGFIVKGVEAVVGHCLGAELAPDRVRRQAIHVHFDVGADAFFRQELSRDYLKTKTVLR